MILTGLNIRSGLELDVPVKDIFKITIEPEGNILAKKFIESKNKKDKKLLAEVNAHFEKEQFLNYSDIKIIHQINDSLICYTYDSYFIYEDDQTNNQIDYEKNLELIFINTELLNFEKFCENLMAAQSFAGNFSKPEFNHPFMGVGNFDLQDYIPLHPLISHSSINLINFYVYHRNILSSIGYFICGLFENDIREQKKYISDYEFRQLNALLKQYKNNLLNSLRKAEEDDLDFN